MVVGGKYRLYGVRQAVHHPRPWTYPVTHPGYARDWPYTLLVYWGGFKQRIYDWEGPIEVIADVG